MAPDREEPACRLRPVRPEDLDQLVRLDRRCFPPAIAFDRWEMMYYLTATRHFIRLAVPWPDHSPPLLGFIIAAEGGPGREGQIVTLDVHPEARRQGIGQLLMAAAEQRLAALGNPVVRLQVAENNAGARSFYQGLGYRHAGQRPDYYPDGTDAMEMIKLLSGPKSRDSAG